MKKYVILLIFLTIASCAGPNQWYPYDSDADIDSKTEFCHSSLRYIHGPYGRNLYKPYGVFVGVDNELLKYLLIAPRHSLGIAKSVNPYAYYNIDFGAVLSIRDAESLIHFLKTCEEYADSTKGISRAEYISYTHVPEIYYIEPLTGQEVKEEDIKFSFQLNNDGYKSQCILGQKGGKLKINFKKKKSLLEMRQNIEKALRISRKL